MLTFVKLKEVAGLLLGDENPMAAHVSPVYASLKGLPPTLVQAVSTEILFHDSTRFVAKAVEDGVDASLSVWHKVPHVFQLLAPYLTAAEKAHLEVNQFINHRLANLS